MRKLWIVALGLWSAAVAAVKPSYVAVEKASSHVGFYDAEGKCLKEVKVGEHPHELVFSPDGRYLYTTDNGVLWMTEKADGNNTVSIVDTRTQENVGTIDLGKYRRPHGIDIDPKTGNLLVTTELPSALLSIDPRTKKILKVYDVHGEAPHIVKLLPNRIWAFTSNTNTGEVAAINLQTSEVKLIPVGERPQGAALSPDHRRLYVCNSGGASISVIDTEAKTKIGDIATGKGPVRVGVTPDGNTIVYALQTGEAVGFANTKTMKEQTQVPLPGQPVSLSFSADYKVAFSSVQSQDKICVIPLATRKIEKVIQAPAGAGPDPYVPMR